MSRRSNAPYTDTIEDDGRVLIYEGHDAPRKHGEQNPKFVDQPLITPAGIPTQNGLFQKAAEKAARGGTPEIVAVYDKIRAGIWVFNGFFLLTEARIENDGKRNVCRFRLELLASPTTLELSPATDLEHSRLIPSAVKVEVWKRDRGRCVLCRASDNLHLDHDLPYSKGGSSLTAANIRLLCARHNLKKSDKIE